MSTEAFLELLKIVGGSTGAGFGIFLAYGLLSGQLISKREDKNKTDAFSERYKTLEKSCEERYTALEKERTEDNRRNAVEIEKEGKYAKEWENRHNESLRSLQVLAGANEQLSEIIKQMIQQQGSK